MTIRVKGYDIVPFVVRDSANRRAQQFANGIIDSLGKLGVVPDQIDIPLEHIALKKVSASVLWFMDGHRLFFSNNSNRFVDNLYIISKVIAFEVDAVLSKRKPVDEFIREFSEDEDVDKQRKEARVVLGIPADCKDMALIDSKFKELAKEFHPDKPSGDAKKFKEINQAHKTLKRELA